MSKFVLILVVSSLVGLAAPSVFERYRAQMLSGQVETLDPAPTLQDAAVASPVPGRVARLTADREGHFRADVRMNGRPVPVLVDTGATLVAIDEATARRLGIVLRPADWRHSVQTANGTAPAAVARLDRVELGPLAVRNVDVMIMRDGNLPTALLGMSFLNRLRFESDGSQLTLRQ
ncbi:TIGR02281 family clan AA aspartic protease [Aurantimonas sp. HBX-1]|uniref:retropepsin-like aspartic protease family protein n=1 Tax=Aurantimonas sp. HBX-1 TaxID=2906072 RepID=UPI001F346380|nr:TIGR02281 family clan AA aspartic protease [Aurantimonas sp. HBX-1]UIJ71441.1 TIGR02281 family clan AA aspartic protease [Aurantimonas sp. HBX-1]